MITWLRIAYHTRKFRRVDRKLVRAIQELEQMAATDDDIKTKVMATNGAELLKKKRREAHEALDLYLRTR